jgi:hypothetical protein
LEPFAAFTPFEHGGQSSLFVCQPLWYSRRQDGNGMKYTLSVKPVARSRTGVEYGTGPVMLYEVEGLPEGQKISIRNVRPATQEPVWQIGVHSRGRETRWTGTFQTAEEALTQLQEELDSVDEEISGVAQ